MDFIEQNHGVVFIKNTQDNWYFDVSYKKKTNIHETEGTLT